jgi:hypothetical protein
VSGLAQYEIWEIGEASAPSPTLSNLMVGDERLLWLAILPADLLRTRWLWGILITLGFAALLLSVVWGQSWTEYCGDSRRCDYPVVWFMAVFCTLFALYLVQLVLRNQFSPFSYFFGISTERAVWIAGNKPSSVWSSPLDRNAAGIDWFGNVRFGSARFGVSFHGLKERHATRAVFWANEGRLRLDKAGGGVD